MHSARNDSLQVVRDTPRFTGKPLPLGHAFRWAGLTAANRSGIGSYDARRTALSVPKCAKQPPTLGGNQWWSLSAGQSPRQCNAADCTGWQQQPVQRRFYHIFSLTMVPKKRNRLGPTISRLTLN